MQLVVQAVDKTNPNDFYADCHLPKRGDVIDVFADDFDLTKYPLVVGNPDWAIISVPGATLNDIQPLLTMERDPNPSARLDWRLASKTLQYRGHGLNLDALITVAKGTTTATTGETDTVSVLANTVQKQVIADPAIIGPLVPTDPIVIG